MPDLASLMSQIGGGAPAPQPGAPPPGGGGAGAGAGAGAVMQAAKPNTGPATVPQGNPGNMASAMSEVSNAIRMLERALPSIPMGTPIHTEILKALTQLGKHIPAAGEGQPGLELNSLLNTARSQAQASPSAALQRLMPPPNTPPAMPPAA